LADDLAGFDNIDFAVLSRIQELSERFGLKPYDFTATLDHSQNIVTSGMGVKFQNMADGPGPEKRVKQMFKAIGISEDSGVLQGGEKKVIDALDHALSIAPKPRTRP
jgi:hypothetical protein